MQTVVEIGSAVRKIIPDKKNKQIESIRRVAQLTMGARLTSIVRGLSAIAELLVEPVLIQQCIVEQHSAVGYTSITIMWKCNFVEKQSCIETRAVTLPFLLPGVICYF